MDPRPSSPPKGVRALAAACIAVVLTVVGLNYAGQALWPQYAKFFPPPLLLLGVLITTFYALLVWRTEWVVAKFFPGRAVPEIGAQDRLAAWIGVTVAALLTGLWLKSLLAI